MMLKNPPRVNPPQKNPPLYDYLVYREGFITVFHGLADSEIFRNTLFTKKQLISLNPISQKFVRKIGLNLLSKCRKFWVMAVLQYLMIDPKKHHT